MASPNDRRYRDPRTPPPTPMTRDPTVSPSSVGTPATGQQLGGRFNRQAQQPPQSAFSDYSNSDAGDSPSGPRTEGGYQVRQVSPPPAEGTQVQRGSQQVSLNQALAPSPPSQALTANESNYVNQFPVAQRARALQQVLGMRSQVSAPSAAPTNVSRPTAGTQQPTGLSQQQVDAWRQRQESSRGGSAGSGWPARR